MSSPSTKGIGYYGYNKKPRKTAWQKENCGREFIGFRRCASAADLDKSLSKVKGKKK